MRSIYNTNTRDVTDVRTPAQGDVFIFIFLMNFDKMGMAGRFLSYSCTVAHQSGTKIIIIIINITLLNNKICKKNTHALKCAYNIYNS